MHFIIKTLLVLSSLTGFIAGSPIEEKQQDIAVAQAIVNPADYRLPTDVLPETYELEITPYFANVSFYWDD